MLEKSSPTEIALEEMYQEDLELANRLTEACKYYGDITLQAGDEVLPSGEIKRDNQILELPAGKYLRENPPQVGAPNKTAFKISGTVSLAKLANTATQKVENFKTETAPKLRQKLSSVREGSRAKAMITQQRRVASSGRRLSAAELTKMPLNLKKLKAT